MGLWAAADPVSGRYLVVWLADPRPRGQAVMARLVDAGGRPLGEPLEVGEGMSVSVAFDTGTRRYLVTYAQVGLIWGRLLDADGKFASNPFPIAAFWYPRNSLARRPIATAAPGHSLFLVTWSDNLNRGGATEDVYMQLVSAEGRPIPPARPAVADGRHSEYIGWRSVAYDPNRRRFIVIWEQTNPYGLWYRTVGLDGRMGPKRFLQIPGVQPSLFLDTERDRLLLAWEDKPKREPRYRLFDLDLRPLAPEQRLPGRQRGVDLPSPAFDPVTQRYLVTWRNDFDPYFYGQWVTVGGKPAGRPFIAAKLRSFSQVSFPLPRRDGGFLLFYEDATETGSSLYNVILARVLHPRDRLQPATVSRPGRYD